MAVEFYNVKTRQKVQIDDSKIRKTKYSRTAKDGSVQYRYAFRAQDNGVNLTKFVSKDVWDAVDAPVEE
ncbi:MAG: hypothetical protein N2691_06120 [Patescibacteria group bacterium]|nr:hypothetical protein [Patescibacteria group bacterium]